MLDKFSATWVSHSSISDYLKCPRSYFLKNVYKDPKTRRKVTLVTPALALGQVVHEVLDCLYEKRVEERFTIDVLGKFEECWSKVSGKNGGFFSRGQEEQYKVRGKEMVKKVLADPGPLKNKAVKINLQKSENSEMPAYYLSDRDNIIVCGKIDWIEYNEDGSINIIDFKTGKHEESAESLQLPIYVILAIKGQKRQIKKICYWYLEGESRIIEVELPKYEQAISEVLKVALEIKKAREQNIFLCPRNGCFCCKPYEDILLGNAEKVGIDNMKRDIYIYLAQEERGSDRAYEFLSDG